MNQPALSTLVPPTGIRHRTASSPGKEAALYGRAVGSSGWRSGPTIRLRLSEDHLEPSRSRCTDTVTAALVPAIPDASAPRRAAQPSLTPL